MSVQQPSPAQENCRWCGKRFFVGEMVWVGPYRVCKKTCEPIMQKQLNRKLEGGARP